MIKNMTAVFPKLDGAIGFEKRLLEGRDGAEDISRQGKTVTFTVDMRMTNYADRPDGGAEEFESWCSLVGHYGTLSPGFMAAKSKMATLNGHYCIGEY